MNNFAPPQIYSSICMDEEIGSNDVWINFELPGKETHHKEAQIDFEEWERCSIDANVSRVSFPRWRFDIPHFLKLDS